MPEGMTSGTLFKSVTALCLYGRALFFFLRALFAMPIRYVFGNLKSAGMRAWSYSEYDLDGEEATGKHKALRCICFAQLGKKNYLWICLRMLFLAV